MNTNVASYDFEGNKIRNLIKEDGSIWFVAKDVCKVLGLTDTNKALIKLYDNEKLTRQFFVSGQNRDLYIISESGLYKLIMRSTKPEAIRFQDWVTQEVLPKIRRDGGYINPQAIDPKNPIESFQVIVENMYRAYQGLEKEYLKSKEEIKILEPKAQMLEDFLKPSNTDISFNTMSKLSKFITIKDGKQVGGRKLKDKCIEEGIIGKKDRLPNQLYINKGYFKVFYARAANGMLNPVCLITPKGQKWLYNRMLKHFNKAA